MKAAEYAVLAVDTSEPTEVYRLLSLARKFRLPTVKFGLEIDTAFGWRWAASLADKMDLNWIMDAKLVDIKNTIGRAVTNIAAYKHPPTGLTIFTRSGVQSLSKAQAVAQKAGITIFGVTQLTSIDDEETQEYENADSRLVVWRESRRAVAAKIGGLVCSAREVGMIKADEDSRYMDTLVPGTRSLGVDSNDQARVDYPAAAILSGANRLVVGRQVTQAENPEAALELFLAEIEDAIL